MEPRFDKSNLSINLKMLTKSQAFYFGLSCCQRYIYSCKVLQQITDWTGYNTLLATLDFLWDRGMATDPTVIKQYISKCEMIMPDADDYNTDFVAFAQYSICAIGNMCDYLLTGDTEDIASSAENIICLLDLYIQILLDSDLEGDDLENGIDNHALMQQELSQMRVAIESLKQGSDFLAIRTKAQERGAQLYQGFCLNIDKI